MKVVKKRVEKPLLISCLVASGLSTGVMAQPADNVSVDEIVITGARGRPRSLADSPVPVDVFNSDEIESVSYTDTNDVLMTLVPSYSVSRQPISDGGTFIRPAQLRGMPTDKTLVLVNSKRRHRAALVGIGGSGTQGPDIATIPSSAIKTVEVLRDGAAAQYGSDAIAGVINFILKDNADGGSFSADMGEYSEGDGQNYTLTGNIGFPLGANGFMSISGEVSEADSTNRGVQYCESWFCADPTSPLFSDPDASYPGYMDALSTANIGDEDVVQPWGQPNVEAQRLFFNSALPIGGSSEVYAFGNYSRSESDGAFFYRYPGNGTIEDLRRPDGSIYSPLEKFPGGFTPRFFGEVYDTSLAGGYRGDLMNGFSYDVSARWGESEIEYTLRNTINPSMGPESPTSFRPGDLINEEMQVQADFSYEFESGLASPALLAFGLSYLDESYEIAEGEPDSYTIGPYATPDPWNLCNADGTPTTAGAAVDSLDCADSSDPVFTTVSTGANGFPGYSPDFSDKYSRDSYSVYADLSADVTDSLFLQGAIRYEDYSDFGSEVVYKLAGMYRLTDTLNLRSSVGTGFRAPTPGQQGTTNVSTRLPDGFPVNTGLFPASGPIAAALGASPLQPELSDNYTFGLTYAADKLSLTVDFYRIDVEDRFYAISTLDVSNEPASGSAYDNYLSLESAVGPEIAQGIGGVFYFTNAFDTTTEGVDVVATYPLDWSNGSSTSLQASLNYNRSEFDSDPGNFLNAEEQYDFENNDPEFRGTLTATHRMDNLRLMARARVFGDYTNSNPAGEGLEIQEFDPLVQMDLEGSYTFNETWSMALGGRNVFDKYPDKDQIGDYCCGRVYSSGTIVDWQGSYYYLRLNANF